MSDKRAPCLVYFSSERTEVQSSCIIFHDADVLPAVGNLQSASAANLATLQSYRPLLSDYGPPSLGFSQVSSAFRRRRNIFFFPTLVRGVASLSGFLLALVETRWRRLYRWLYLRPGLSVTTSIDNGSILHFLFFCSESLFLWQPPSPIRGGAYPKATPLPPENLSIVLDIGAARLHLL